MIFFFKDVYFMIGFFLFSLWNLKNDIENNLYVYDSHVSLFFVELGPALTSLVLLIFVDEDNDVECFRLMAPELCNDA